MNEATPNEHDPIAVAFAQAEKEAKQAAEKVREEAEKLANEGIAEVKEWAGHVDAPEATVVAQSDLDCQVAFRMEEVDKGWARHHMRGTHDEVVAVLAQGNVAAARDLDLRKYRGVFTALMVLSARH